MNQLQNQSMRQNVGGGAQPQLFQVNIVVKQTGADLKIQTSIDPSIPFIHFINGLKEQIFAQRFEAKYEESIEYQLDGLPEIISDKEERTLSELKFFNNCTLQVRLKLKGGK